MRRICILLILCIAVFAATPVAATPKAHCSREHEVRLIRKVFVKAYNSGNLERLDEIFASEGTSQGKFQKYTVGPIERNGFAAGDRSTLIPYFKQRHEEKDRIRIVDFTIGRYERGSNPGFGFSFVLYRDSEEFSPVAKGYFVGKGSIDCRIYFVNMQWERP